MANKVQKIRAEIERRINKLNKSFYTPDTPCGIALQTHKEMLSFIDSIQEEPVSEDLEKEIQDYYNSRREYRGRYNAVIPVYKHQLIDIARHFANWQKKQKSVWHTMDETPNYPCDILFLTNVDNMFLYRYMENGRPVDRETPYFNTILNGKCWCYCNDIVNK